MPEEKVNAYDAHDTVLNELYTKRDEIDAAISAILFLKGSGSTAPETSVRRVASGNGLAIPPNAFFRLGIGDAAKKYLEMVQAKKTLLQIVKALEDGGMPAQKPNTVYAALRRREVVTGDITRVGEEWGLKEWFSNIVTPKPAKNGKGKKSKKKASAKKGASKSVTATAKKSAPIAVKTEETKPTTPAEPLRKEAKPAKGKSITVLDAAHEVLTKEDAPLHADELAERINTSYGKNTNGKSIAATLPGDSTLRFMNIGANTWALMTWPESKRIRANGKASAVATA